mgnify:CR=1 FL=1
MRRFIDADRKNDDRDKEKKTSSIHYFSPYMAVMVAINPLAAHKVDGVRQAIDARFDAYAVGTPSRALGAAISGLTLLAVIALTGGLDDEAELELALEVEDLAREIDAPAVLVGHSYGGAVITQASAELDNVAGLVYLAAFGLDIGEIKTVTFKDFPDPPFGEKTSVQVSVTPVAGEQNTGNNSAEYPVIFSLD